MAGSWVPPSGVTPPCPGVLAGSGECPLLGVTALMCSPCISHRAVPNLYSEGGTEVEMPSLGGGRCALLMVPVPILCRSGAAAPSSSSSYGKHPQILQMAAGQELFLGQAVALLSNTALLPPENTWGSRLVPWRGLNWDVIDSLNPRESISTVTCSVCQSPADWGEGGRPVKRNKS